MQTRTGEAAGLEPQAYGRTWFGPLVAQAAWAMGLFDLARQAFLGDGAEKNWTLWRCYFSAYVPMLDFIHALSYVVAAAHAGRERVARWRVR